MMSDNFAEFPSILWEIKDVAASQAKVSPTISFMGMEWKLKFSYESSGAGKVDLQLVRLKPPFSLNETPFRIESGIHDNINGYRCMSREQSSQLKNKYCCVWTDSITNIQNSYQRCKDVTFYLRIYPASVPFSSVTDSKTDVSLGSPACTISLLKDFRKLVDNGEYADVVLKCGNKKFPAHRAILSARSSVFAAMFRSDMKEAHEKLVEVKGVEPNVLEKLLCYIYSGTIDDLPMESVRQIYLAADMYDVKALADRCFSFMTDNYAKDPKKDSPRTEIDHSDVGKTDNDEQKELLKELFQSIEWQTLALQNPKLARDMCKPVFT